ncbi:MAG: helix-turn-helix transcriptional regulator, partial [Rhodospirillales bacterium]
MKAKQQSEKPQGKKVVELFGGSTGTSAALDRLTLPVVQERLRDVIKKIGPKAAVEASGKSLSMLHRYLNGSVEPPVSVLLGLSFRSGYSPGWFFSPTGVEPATDSGPAATTRIPVLDLVLSAGGGAEAVLPELARDHLALPTAFLRVHLNMNPETAVAFPISGDSMEPTLRDGAMVLLDVSVKTIDGTGIFALR